MLCNKVVLVTGANRGIGKAIAHLFAKHHATLLLNARQEGSLESLKDSLQKEGCEVHTYYFDISDEKAVKSAFQSIFKNIKRLDVLVNNAGIMKSGLVAMVSHQVVNEVFSTNTYGTFYTCQYASRLMSRQKSGSIINFSSIMGTCGDRGQSVYSASKAAIIGMSKSLAKELAPQNIRVNVVAPGFIDTDMAATATEEQRQYFLDHIALGRIGNPEEVANTTLFLASDMASYITGQVLCVDGGMSL